jgi:ABC-type polysaccharide/polyol phosphate export permease
MDATSRVVARTSGIVLLIAGLAIEALFLFVAERQLSLRDTIERSALVVSVVLSIVGFVCIVVGLRLTLNRPNRYQSLLPPLGWYAISLLFAVLGPSLGYLAVRRGDYEHIIGAACSIVIAFWCWKAGRTAASRGRSDQPVS